MSLDDELFVEWFYDTQLLAAPCPLAEGSTHQLNLL